MSLVIEEDGGRSRYCRTYSKVRNALGQKLVELYDTATGPYIFPSGMTAIGCLMHVLSNEQDNPVFIMGKELYCDTPRIPKYLSTFKHLTYLDVDIRDEENIITMFETHNENITIFFTEACTNPSGQFFNFELIEKLRGLAPNCVFCIDNTWLSPALFNPFKHGADVVVESMTKYISAGQCIGGSLLVKNTELSCKIDKWLRTFGIFVGSDHCRLFLQALDTLETRVKTAGALTMQVAQFLENHPKVNRVMYPLLESHPTHEIAVKHIRSGPPCLWFHVNLEGITSMTKLKKILSKNPIITYETSFGSAFSKFDPWPKMGNSGSYDFPGAEGTKGTWIRLAIGYEDNLDNIITGLNYFINP